MQQFIYAQLNQENICVAVSYLSGEVQKENMIRIDQDTALNCMGKRYANGIWEEMPEEPMPEPENQPTNEDIMNLLVNGLTDLDKTLNGGL